MVRAIMKGHLGQDFHFFKMKFFDNLLLLLKYVAL